MIFVYLICFIFDDLLIYCFFVDFLKDFRVDCLIVFRDLSNVSKTFFFDNIFSLTYMLRWA